MNVYRFCSEMGHASFKFKGRTSEKSHMRMTILLIYIVTVSSSAVAELDSSQTEALTNTQKLLRNTKERNKVIAADPKAQEADAKAGALAGSNQNKEEMYDISAELMEKIANDANGDPQKMQDLLKESQKDPQAFYEKYFSDAQKARVRGLANKMEGQRPSLSPRK